MAGDAETGVTIHETVKELDAGPDRGAARVPDRPRTMRARSTRAPPSSPSSCSTRCCPSRRSRRRRARRRTRRRSRPPTASSTSPGREERLNRVRALSPHIGARGELHGRPRHDLARAARGRRARAGRGAARGRQADAVRRVPARPPVIAPARAAAYEVVRRVFEDGAYADRALRTAAEGSTSATARSRSGSRTGRCSACARSTTRSRRSAGGRCASSTAGAGGAAPRRVRARLWTACPRYAAVNESVELVRRARLERAVAFTNAVLRRARRRDRGARRGAAGGAAQALLPGLDLGRLAARPRRGGALALMRAQNEPPPTVVSIVRGRPRGEPTDVPGA